MDITFWAVINGSYTLAERIAAREDAIDAAARDAATEIIAYVAIDSEC